jgi:hypothetical protein
MRLFITWPAIKSKATRIEFEIPISKTKRFWDGLKEGEIYSTRCRSCGGKFFPPVADCPDCRSSDMEWVKLEGRGIVEAFTHVVVKPSSFQGMEPYTIAIARLEDGVKVLAWIREAGPTDVEVGMKVRLVVGATLEGEASYWFVPV